jgi:hypothetical protein
LNNVIKVWVTLSYFKKKKIIIDGWEMCLDIH